MFGILILGNLLHTVKKFGSTFLLTLTKKACYLYRNWTALANIEKVYSLKIIRTSQYKDQTNNAANAIAYSVGDLQHDHRLTAAASINSTPSPRVQHDLGTTTDSTINFNPPRWVQHVHGMATNSAINSTRPTRAQHGQQMTTELAISPTGPARSQHV